MVAPRMGRISSRTAGQTTRLHRSILPERGRRHEDERPRSAPLGWPWVEEELFEMIRFIPVIERGSGVWYSSSILGELILDVLVHHDLRLSEDATIG